MDSAARPTSVSLFTGAGGLDIGLESAGFRTVAAVDSDVDCFLTLQLNKEAGISCGGGHHLLQGARLLPDKVEDVQPAHLCPPGCKADGWTPDLMAGGPPCQPFSRSGKMLSVEDP